MGFNVTVDDLQDAKNQQRLKNEVVFRLKKVGGHGQCPGADSDAERTQTPREIK